MNAPGNLGLPEKLTHYIPDSCLTVMSWNAEKAELTLLLEKEIGPESGIITLRGVSRVCLANRVELSRLEVAKADQRLAEPIEADEVLYIFYAVSWEQPFYVVATHIEYDVRS